MDDLNALVSPVIGAVVIVLAVACVVLLVLVTVLFRRTSAFERRVVSLTRGESRGWYYSTAPAVEEFHLMRPQRARCREDH